MEKKFAVRSWAVFLLAAILCIAEAMTLLAQTRTTSGSSATGAEARKIAAQIFDRAFHKCGEYYYRGRFSYADAKVDIEVVPITRADELNGYQWKSWAILKFSAEAEFNHPDFLTCPRKTKPVIIWKVPRKRSFRNEEDEAHRGEDHRGGEADGSGPFGKGTGA